MTAASLHLLSCSFVSASILLMSARAGIVWGLLAGFRAAFEEHPDEATRPHCHSGSSCTCGLSLNVLPRP